MRLNVTTSCRGYFALQKKRSIVHINLLKNFKVANLNTPTEALELGRDNSSKVREFREGQQTASVLSARLSSTSNINDKLQHHQPFQTCTETAMHCWKSLLKPVSNFIKIRYRPCILVVLRFTGSSLTYPSPAQSYCLRVVLW